MYNVVSKTLGKIGDILSTAYGCAAAAVSFLFSLLVDYTSGFHTIIYIVIFCVFLDIIWGLARAIKQKQYTTSSMFRDSASKLSIYGSLILVFIGIDTVTHSEDAITTTAVSSIIMLAEAWSILANAIIVYPKFPFAKLLMKIVSGEVASKMHCTEGEAEELLFGDLKINQKRRKRNDKEKVHKTEDADTQD